MIYRSQVESSLWNSESASMLSALNLQKKDGGVSKVRICKAGCWATFQNSNNLIGVFLPNSSHDTCIVTHFTVAKEFLAMTRDSLVRESLPQRNKIPSICHHRGTSTFFHIKSFLLKFKFLNTYYTHQLLWMRQAVLWTSTFPLGCSRHTRNYLHYTGCRNAKCSFTLTQTLQRSISEEAVLTDTVIT